MTSSVSSLVDLWNTEEMMMMVVVMMMMMMVMKINCRVCFIMITFICKGLPLFILHIFVYAWNQK